MSKYTIAGLVSWFFSGVLLLFQTISTVMGREEKMVWKSLNLVNVVGEHRLNWIDGLSWVSIQNILNYIVTMPLFLLLFCVGILFFILNRFMSKF